MPSQSDARRAAVQSRRRFLSSASTGITDLPVAESVLVEALAEAPPRVRGGIEVGSPRSGAQRQREQVECGAGAGHTRGAMRMAWRLALPGLAGALCAVAAFGHSVRLAEELFLVENRVAMDKMMKAMDVKPSAGVDRDFAAMMIPHHQGAIDMARAELRYGRNEQLRRIAQGIIVEQHQEIAAMRLALDQPPLPPGSPRRHSDVGPAFAQTQP